MKPRAKKPKPAKVEYIKCPVCGREHVDHPEFGCFCCLSCLQAVIRPLIVTLTNGLR
jgi:ribosomal protein L37AE/L43A